MTRSSARARARHATAVAGLLALCSHGGSVQAACDVLGGGPLVDGATVVCTGSTTTGVVAPSVNGVTVTVMPGATIDAGTGRAIDLGTASVIDARAGSLIRGNPGDALLRTAANGIVTLSGTVDSTAGTAIYAGPDTIVSIYGSTGRVGSANGSKEIYFVYPQAQVASTFAPDYVSNAGTIGRANLNPPTLESAELYNEIGGDVASQVVYNCEIGSFAGGFLATFDSVVVNRGHIGAGNDGYAVVSQTGRVCGLKFTNESTGVVDGHVQVTRSYRAGQGVGVNRGRIAASVVLKAPNDDPSPEWAPAAFGLPQQFSNEGEVGSLVVESGTFVQQAAGTLSSTGTVRVMGLVADDNDADAEPDSFVGQVDLHGAQHTGCLLGKRESDDIGGIVALAAGASFTVAPSAPQSCTFDGVLIGPGALIKAGAGTQILGTTPIPPGNVVRDWEVTRPATSYAGGTTIAAGTLAVTASDALGTGAVTFSGAGARLRYDAPALVTANALAFGADAVIDTQGFDVTIDGARSGNAVLRKAGTGTLVLAGATTHGGATSVDVGTLRLAAGLAGAATVADGATLAGNGQVAGGTLVQSGGRLFPSAGIAAGAVIQTGATELASLAKLKLAITPAASDRIVATSLSIGGAALELEAGVPPTVGTVTTIAEVVGGAAVVGTFTGLPEGAMVYNDRAGLRISYRGGDGNDVTLTRMILPDAPSALAAASGDGQLVLTFAPPMPNGSAPITGYRASCTPGEHGATASSASIVVGGLTNGTAYSCVVRSLTAESESLPTHPVAATPRGRASAPTAVVATAGVASFGVTFGAPLVDGGSPVTQYRLGCEPGAIVVTAAASPIGVTGVSNGVTYACELAAQTAAGPGSAASFTVRPRTVPDAPTALVATPYNQSARFDFVPPAFDGGAPITQYTVRCPPGGQRVAEGPGSPITMTTGLNNGSTYQCHAFATNVAGAGSVSANAGVTPIAVPSAVTGLVVADEDRSTTLTFAPPTLGAPILDYRVTCEPGAASYTQAGAPLQLAPLVNYATYACEISARNAQGRGPGVVFAARPAPDCAAKGGDFDRDSVCDAIDADDDADGIDDVSDPCPLDAANNCPASAPIARARTVITAKNAAVEITLTADDPDRDVLTYEILAAPSHGALTGDGATRSYAPAAEFSGIDTLTFRVNDGTYDSNAATISIEVRETADAVYRDGFEALP